MKKFIMCVCAIVAVLVTNVVSADSASDQKNLGYTMGFRTGAAMKADNILVDNNAYVKGMADGLSGKKSRLSNEKMVSIMTAFQKQMMQKAQQQMKQTAQINLIAGKKFLAANAKKPGVVTLKNGMQYKIIEKGKGSKPQAADVVTVDYTGTLINGKVFDASSRHGGTAKFPLNGVIPGWTQGLQRMKQGATWMLYIPPQLAYKDRGVPGIGPNQTLIFRVHLIKVASS